MELRTRNEHKDAMLGATIALLIPVIINGIAAAFVDNHEIADHVYGLSRMIVGVEFFVAMCFLFKK